MPIIVVVPPINTSCGVSAGIHRPRERGSTHTRGLTRIVTRPCERPRELVRGVAVAGEAMTVGQRERQHADAARPGPVVSLCRHLLSR